MVPVSYFVFPLILLLFYNKTYASLFYPFVLVTTVIGITLLLCLIFFPKFSDIFYKLFPNTMTANIKSHNLKFIVYISLIVLKIFIDIIWPKNLSLQAVFISICYFIFYMFIYGLYIIIKLYHSSKTA
jgi:hypothetical protein